MARIEVKFAGNKKVNAIVNGFEIKTDQPVEAGGEATHPTPYDLFLACRVDFAYHGISYFKNLLVF